MKLYVASSWRNPYQPNIVELLRLAEHDVYDFRHPPGGDHLGFSWGEVDRGWETWRPEEYLRALSHPVAVAGFESDFSAMQWADACVLVLPCARSAHLEAGWFVGAGKPLVILLDEAEWPGGHATAELMYRMATAVAVNIEGMLEALQQIERGTLK